MRARAHGDEGSLDELHDAQLVDLARGGDQAAFAELYARYVGAVHDFLARMMRNRAEAEDVTQDTFVRAMQALGGLQQGASFRSWIFTIARNTALNRLERSRRVRPLAFQERDEGEERELDIVDPDRLGDPQEAAGSAAIAALVWEAAAGLSPKEYSLLDLHLRQGLDSREIADVLGVTKNNAYVMLNRLRNSVEASIGAYVMMRSGRAGCPQLDAELTRIEATVLSPAARRAVDRHVSGCATCQQTKAEMVSPLSILGALAPIPIAPAAQQQILGDVLSQWPTSPAADRRPPRRTPSEAARGWYAAHRSVVASLIAGLGLVLLTILVPGSPLGDRLFSRDSASGPATLTLSVSDPTGSPIPGVLFGLYEEGGGPALRSGASNLDGALVWPDLPAGDYLVTIVGLPAGVAGAGEVERTVTLDPGAAVNLDIDFQAIE